MASYYKVFSPLQIAHLLEFCMFYDYILIDYIDKVWTLAANIPCRPYLSKWQQHNSKRSKKASMKIETLNRNRWLLLYWHNANTFDQIVSGFGNLLEVPSNYCFIWGRVLLLLLVSVLSQIQFCWSPIVWEQIQIPLNVRHTFCVCFIDYIA